MSITKTRESRGIIHCHHRGFGSRKERPNGSMPDDGNQDILELAESPTLDQDLGELAPDIRLAADSIRLEQLMVGAEIRPGVNQGKLR